MRRIFVLIGALILAGCSGTATVPPVDVEGPAGMAPVPGKFAVQIQTGGWKLKTEPTGMTCGVWTFDVDLNGPYKQALEKALRGGLQTVDFVDDTLTPQDIKAKGYDAEIVLYQTNADATFGVDPGFFTGTANSNISLSVILAINNASGLVTQQTITGKGSGKNSGMMFCNGVSPAVSAAARAALQDIGRTSLLYVRDSLLQQRLKSASTN